VPILFVWRPSATRVDGMRRVAAAFIAIVIALSVCACSPVSSDPGAEHPGPAVEPASPDLSTPEGAVLSYLDWVSYAYRVAESDEASHTMTPWEWVRVDAYIELNRQQDRAIDQTLTTLRPHVVSLEDTRAVVTASEEWTYRYITMSTGYYDGSWVDVSYETTYTLELTEDSWLVDRTEAEALTPVE